MTDNSCFDKLSDCHSFDNCHCAAAAAVVLKGQTDISYRINRIIHDSRISVVTVVGDSSACGESKAMAAQVHQFKVAMTCTGCSGAVERVLGKLQGKGVEKVDIQLEERTVLVTSTLPADELLAVIKKTGKETEYVGVKK